MNRIADCAFYGQAIIAISSSYMHLEMAISSNNPKKLVPLEIAELELCHHATFKKDRLILPSRIHLLIAPKELVVSLHGRIPVAKWVLLLGAIFIFSIVHTDREETIRAACRHRSELTIFRRCPS